MYMQMLSHKYFFCLDLCPHDHEFSCDDGGTCADDGTTGQALCVCRQPGKFCTGDCSGTYEFLTEGSQSCSGKKGSLAVYY